jgi:hypothetical protein
MRVVRPWLQGTDLRACADRLRRNAYRMLTHLQPVPFCVRRATAADVDRLLALQDDCRMRIQVRVLPLF